MKHCYNIKQLKRGMNIASSAWEAEATGNIGNRSLQYPKKEMLWTQKLGSLVALQTMLFLKREPLAILLLLQVPIKGECAQYKGAGLSP